MCVCPSNTSLVNLGPTEYAKLPGLQYDGDNIHRSHLGPVGLQLCRDAKIQTRDS